jgi:putative ABC transport system ATP-binding protein
MTASPVAAALNVSKTYGSAGHRTTALDDVSVEARAGELVLLLGPSGSGKTTLLTIVAGLEKPTSGAVTLFGKNLADYSPRQLQKLRACSVGFVFQTFQLIDALSVLDNVLLVTRFARLPRVAARERALGLLERFGVGKLARAYPRTLSQGEKQRVAVARALVNEARLVIADEPTASLASQQGFEIVKLLRTFATNENRCVVVASHDERIAEFSDRVLRLRDGCLASAV